MKVVETEFEILRISEPVSLPFEGLDFVYQTLDGAAGDAMIEVVEKSSSIGPKGLAHSFERLDSGVAWRLCTRRQRIARPLCGPSFSQKSLNCSFME